MKAALDPITRRLALSGGAAPPAVALMYHAVAPDSRTPAWPWAVSMAHFREHLDILTDLGYATVTIDDLVQGPPRGRVVALTFDDGYADNMVAAEELARRGMRASWFVVTGSIGREPDWSDPGRPPGRLMDAAELRTLRQAGMQVGSHTASHLRMPVAGADAVARELRESRVTLEDLLGEPVDTFAYPYGQWDADCEAAVRAAGYRAACTTQTGWALLDRDPLRIRRLTVFNGDGAGRLARKLTLGSHDVGWGDMARYLARRAAGRFARQG